MTGAEQYHKVYYALENGVLNPLLTPQEREDNKNDIIRLKSEIVIEQKEARGESPELFKEHFSKHPEDILSAETQLNPSLNRVFDRLERGYHHMPSMKDGQLDVERDLKRQFHLAVSSCEKRGVNADDFKMAFSKSPSDAIEAQRSLDKEIDRVLDPSKVSEVLNQQDFEKAQAANTVKMEKYEQMMDKWIDNQVEIDLAEQREGKKNLQQSRGIDFSH